MSPLEEILNEIERQTDYLFMYSNAVDVEKTRINPCFRETRIGGPESVAWKSSLVRNGRNTHQFCPTSTDPRNTIIVQQEDKIPVKGKITDMAGEPIIGASILEKGTTNGIITDLNGGFSLDVSPGSHTCHLVYRICQTRSQSDYPARL